MSHGRVYALLFVLMMVMVPLTALGGVGLGFKPPPFYHNATIRVTLLHQNGTPAVGYGLQLTSSEGSWGGLSGTTNSTGKATLSAWYGYWGPQYLYAIKPPSERVGKTMLIVEPDGSYDIIMRVNAPYSFDRIVKGTITNRSTGLPVKDIGVQLGGFDSNDNQVLAFNITGPDGKYEIVLPYLSNRVDIHVSEDDYRHTYTHFFMRPDVYEYEYDIDLVPLYINMKNVQLKFINTTTGRVMDDLNTYMNGKTVHLDHASSQYDPVLNSQGYYETWAGNGEYILSADGDIQDRNASFTFETSVIIDGQDFKRDVHVDVPDLANLEIRLWNGTAPMQGCQLSYMSSMMMDEATFGYYAITWTDENGFGRFGVPRDKPVTVTSYLPGYVPISYIFDHSLHTEPYTLNLTAVKAPVINYPTGNITITLKDPVTGVSIPKFMANFYGSDDVGGVYYYAQANETGVLKKVVRAGHYDSINLDSSLGSRSLQNINVPAGSDLPLVLTLERRSLPPQYVNCTFRVVDPSDNPVPNLFIRYSNFYGNWISGSSITTDMNGDAFLRIRPGSLVLTSYESAFEGVNPYVFHEVRSDIGANGLDLGTITAYPALPKSPYTGTIKDEATGDALSMVHVSTVSIHTDEGVPLFSYHGFDPDSIPLSDIESFSEPGGKFRGWGNDQVLVAFQKEGYLPKGVWGSISGRGPLGDIELEPMPEMTSFVSGTVVNVTDAPIESELGVFDKERDTPTSVNYQYTGMNGEFNISLYPGEFTIIYSNGDELDWIDITVPEGGLSGLKLVHRPNAELEGFVSDGSGSRMVGQEVLLLDPTEDPPSIIARTITNNVGFYDLKTYQGDYKVSVERSNEHDGYLSPILTSDGDNDLDHDIVLLNRSQADVVGKLTGDGGPYAGGIPWATVKVLASDNTTLMEVGSDSEGKFRFPDVTHGTGLKLYAAPPANLSGEVDTATGYLPTLVVGLTVSGYEVVRDIELTYYVLPPPPLVNITDFGPIGTDVLIDASFLIEFSVPMNATSVENAFLVSPQVLDLDFTWDENWTSVVVTHSPFAYNTTYTVTLNGSIISLQGAGPWSGAVLNWSFTTVREGQPPIEGWEIFSADVTVDATDKDVEVEVLGLANMTIYVVIQNVGSYKLTGTMLGENGTYTVTVPGAVLAWNTTYSYHFSNVTAGPDLAPAFKGTFKTPAQTVVPDDDDDDDDDDGPLDKFGAAGICLIVGLVLIIIIVIVVVVFMLVRKKGETGEGEGKDEEEMSWGEE